MTQAAQALVGRDRELEALERALSEAATGAPRFAQVTGEPGIGKSHLLAELGRRADADGWLVLNGRAAELERELPFGLVIDTFDAYLGALDPQTFERIAREDMIELAGIFPSLRSLSPSREQPGTAAERFRAHRVVNDLIERLAARQPVLLLLDDLHWADAASVEQACFVLRRPPEAAVMIVGSFRTGQADPALVAAVAAAVRDGSVEQIELGPLAADEAARLVGSQRSTEALYAESGGNPFYLLQLARDRERTPSATAGAQANGGVPAAVAASIAAELDALSPVSRELAQGAAVAGDPFELDLAVAIAGVPEQDAYDALDELIAGDLVRSADAPRRFEFRHPLVRGAIYEAFSPGARLAAHQRAAQALAERGAPASARAHHVEHTARHGDAEAVEVLREAGLAAAGRAPASAARWLAAALRILPREARPEERLGLLVALAGAQGATGEFEATRRTLIEAIEVAPEKGPMARVRLVGSCAAIERLLGRREQSHHRLAEALAQLTDESGPEAASLMIDLAVDSFSDMDYDGMEAWAARAAAVASALDDRPLHAVATATVAWALAAKGEAEEGEERRADAAALVDAMPDEQLAERLDAVGHLAGAEFQLCRYEAAGAHARRGLELARTTGQGGMFPILVQALANVLFTTGRLDDAARLLDEAVDAARTSSNMQSLWWALLTRAFQALWAGEIDTALRLVEEGAEVGRGIDDSVVAAWAATILGGVMLEAGDAERAAKLLSESAGGEGMPMMPGAWRATWLEQLTRARLAIADREGAARAAAAARAIAESSGLPLAEVGADRAEAEVAQDAGEFELGARLALSSAAGAERIGARIDEAGARALAGEVLERVGERDAAIRELERAAAIFEECGASRYRDQAEHELRKLGQSVHRRSARGRGEGIESLTGRELEVARLVVDRRTNPEIAAELFLSVKTVESHLRNIFRKLDASSRVEVARIVERADSG
jgi:ATP/maltotriose-dependent transcriptional regulator MalT